MLYHLTKTSVGINIFRLNQSIPKTGYIFRCFLCHARYSLSCMALVALRTELTLDRFILNCAASFLCLAFPDCTAATIVSFSRWERWGSCLNIVPVSFL